MQCRKIAKSTGNQCIHAAVYMYRGEPLCGTHCRQTEYPDRDNYLIRNNSKTSNTSDSEKKVLSGKLLNSAKTAVPYQDMKFPCAEAAYQAAKFYYKHEDPETHRLLMWRVYDIMKASDTDEIIKLGHLKDLPIRPDWNLREGDELYSTKDCIMFKILEDKFSGDLRKELMDTGDLELISRGGGEYWSTGANGRGRNRLGDTLMLIRTDFAA